LSCVLSCSRRIGGQIRHCAMNTLFSAMAAHAGIISANQWRLVFEDIIFCLFKKAGDRSAHAMR
jgi:hypothetical protein